MQEHEQDIGFPEALIANEAIEQKKLGVDIDSAYIRGGRRGYALGFEKGGGHLFSARVALPLLEKELAEAHAEIERLKAHPALAIESTLKTVDNESTDAPYWLIIDPSALIGSLVYKAEDDPDEPDEGSSDYVADLESPEVLRSICEVIPHCITGPFFSREDAKKHLSARKYAFSDRAYVYCHSGYWSNKYKQFWRELENETSKRN